MVDTCLHSVNCRTGLHSSSNFLHWASSLLVHPFPSCSVYCEAEILFSVMKTWHMCCIPKSGLHGNLFLFLIEGEKQMFQRRKEVVFSFCCILWKAKRKSYGWRREGLEGWGREKCNSLLLKLVEPSWVWRSEVDILSVFKPLLLKGVFFTSVAIY